MGTASDPNTWVKQYGDALYRYALLRLKDPDLAQDIVQETFLAALKARERFAGDSSEKTWLIGILKHKVIDHFRKSQRIEPIEDIETEVDQQFDQQFDQRGHWTIPLNEWHQPNSSLENEEFWQIFTDCVSKLPTHLGDLFILREFQGLESDELCKVMEISTTNNMWVMLSRARNRLRQCLDSNWFSLDKAPEI